MTNRKILTPAAPGALAVAELKAWLGIAAQAEDDQLESLLTNAIEACEAFTGQMPLIQACEEVLPVAGSFRTLATRPVNTLLGGEGIAADQLPHVFERFCCGDSARTREQQGSGIGLTISLAIIRAHGGSLPAASAGPERGSTFTFTLPGALHRLRTEAV